MSKIEVSRVKEIKVQFPKKEKAYALLSQDDIPYKSAVVGITYPIQNYVIKRSERSNVCVFEYILSGEGEVFIDGKWRRAAAGDFYILSSGYEHYYRAVQSNPWKKIWINYVADYMPYYLKSYGVKMGIYHSESVKLYFEELLELARSGVISDDLPFKISDILNKIIKNAAMQKNSVNDEYGMRKIIAEYVYKKLNLDELATEFHMSKSNLIRVFKKKYGITPYEYLLELKLETAKILLKDTKLTIKEISDKLCVSDEHYFSTLFLKKVGSRPGTYRKNIRDELLYNEYS